MNAKVSTPPWAAAGASQAADTGAQTPPASSENSATNVAADPAAGTPPAADPAPAAQAAPVADPAPAVAEQATQAAKETVTVTVPKAYRLRLDPQTELQIPAGVQEMKPEHASHWYSVANGVTVYQKPTE